MRHTIKTRLTDLLSALWPSVSPYGPHDDLVLRPFRPIDDFLAVQDLSDDALGAGYLDVATHTSVENVFVAEKNGRVIGFAIAYSEYAEAVYANRLPGRPDTCHIPGDARVGILAAIVLHLDYRGQGIGYRLLRYAVSRYPGQPIFALGWKPKSRAPHIERPLLQSGFQSVKLYTDFWREDSVRRGYLCPVCGNPCTCDMQLYLRLPQPIANSPFSLTRQNM